MTGIPMDAIVQRTLAARISADTGIDGQAALAMVKDVRDRGADSPHAQVVGAAASAVIAPVAEAFGRLAAAMTTWGEQVARSLAPAVKALSENPEFQRRYAGR